MKNMMQIYDFFLYLQWIIQFLTLEFMGFSEGFI